MEYTMEIATDILLPNFIVYRKFRDGEHYAWRVVPAEGYVMYDTADKNYDLDPETGEEIPVTHYYTVALLPRNFPWQSFSWVAVPRDSVDEKYIF